MDTSVLVALITGIVTIIATVLTVRQGNTDMQHQLEIANAIQNEQIQELTREVRKHNEFAERIPAIEGKIENINFRLKKLEDDSK